MPLHNLLLRQLKRCGLSEQELPTTAERWQKFLERINQAYYENDQDRYTLERSQEISSREMRELNEQLAESQKIAHLGSWFYDSEKNEIKWSIETYKILGFDPSEEPPDYEKLLNIFYEDDRQLLAEAVQQALTQGKDYELEVRYKFGNQYRWIQAVGQAMVPKDGSKITQLSGTVLDITRRKLAELSQNMEHSIARILSETDIYLDAVPQIMKIIGESLGWRGGVYWHWNNDEKVFHRVSEWHVPNELFDRVANQYESNIYTPNLEQDLLTRVFEEKKPFWIDNIQKDQPLAHNASAVEADLHSIFAFPIIMDDKVVGIMKFFGKDTEQPNAEVLQNIQNIQNLIRQFIQRKTAQEKVVALNEQLITTARQAGMAEIATSVLHNIGNVLNSVNVSVNLLSEKLKNSKLASLSLLSELVSKNKANFVQFIQESSQGKQLPEFLIKLADYWQQEEKEILKELGNLSDNINHIKEIVIMQQSVSGVFGMIEPIDVTELLETAYKIHDKIFEKYDIKIKREYEIKDPIAVDKIKLQQILINLVRNAKDAVLANSNPDKQVILRAKRLADNKVEIQVADNGIGIAPENSTRIFSYGFTTKKDGHGFGLHTSALSAQEMGGKLSVVSGGVGKGATFTVELPLGQ